MKWIDIVAFSIFIILFVLIIIAVCGVMCD